MAHNLNVTPEMGEDRYEEVIQYVFENLDRNYEISNLMRAFLIVEGHRFADPLMHIVEVSIAEEEFIDYSRTIKIINSIGVTT